MAAGLQPSACQETHTSVSGLHFGSPPPPPLPLSCNSYEQCARPPLLHSRVRNGKEANFPSSVRGHTKTEENQRRRKIKDIGQLRQMKGQRVGKGREAGEQGGYKPLPNHCKPSDEIILGRGSWKNQLKEGGKSGQGLTSAEIHFYCQCPVAAGDDSHA